MATVQLSLPALDLPEAATTVELASEQAQGVGTSTDDDWGAGIVILAVVLAIAAVVVGVLGFRSNARKKERLEHDDTAPRRH